MKKLIISIILIITFVVSIFLVACDSNVNNNNSNNNNNPFSPKTFYYDNSNIVIDGIQLSFSCSETNYSNYSLSINITATNNNTQDCYFDVKDISLTNETSNVQYDVKSSYINTQNKLQYQIKNTFTYSSTIPTSYKDEHYVFRFLLNNNTIIIKLYETPDELREDLNISYKIYYYGTGGAEYQQVYTQKVKYGRSLDSIYTYEDNSHDYYCDTWYTDENRNNSFNKNTKFYKDTFLYGIRSSMIKYSIDQDEKWINGINYVPSDGIIKIEPSYSTQKVYLSNFGLYNNSKVKIIYLPKNLKKIYMNNFDKMNSLEEIHFEGSKSEWDAIETSSTIPSTVRIIYNSSI